MERSKISRENTLQANARKEVTLNNAKVGQRTRKKLDNRNGRERLSRTTSHPTYRQRTYKREGRRYKRKHECVLGDTWLRLL